MHTFTTIGAKAATVLLVAGFAAAEPWGGPATTPTTPVLATITPWPGAPSSLSWSPITVTSQYQTVSTCAPVSACFKGFCKTSYSCAEYAYVSTVIPCFDGTGQTSTTVTATDDVVTISNWVTTLTSYATPTGHFKGHHPKPTPVYSTIAKEFYVPYSEIGPFAIPGYPGSGLCGDDCAVKPDGSTWQALNVTECHSGPQGPKCVQYVETWVSASAPATTASATGFCSSHAFAPSAGTWTFTFPFTAPAPPAVTAGPTAWAYDPKPWFWEITKTCDGPSDWVITTTVTKTVTFTVPPSTSPATSTSPIAFPTGPNGHPGFPGFPHAPSTPTPTSPASSGTYIQVYDSGAKYHSNTPNYIGFSDDDAIIVTDQSSAAWFVFADGALTFNGEYIGADSAWGYQAFQKYSSAPSVYSGWSNSGSGISWAFGSGSASFCVTPDNSLFISLTSSPSFACKPVDLSSGGAKPSYTSTSTWSSTTSWATADPSADPEPPVETERSNVKHPDGGW